MDNTRRNFLSGIGILSLITTVTGSKDAVAATEDRIPRNTLTIGTYGPSQYHAHAFRETSNGEYTLVWKR